MTVIENLERSLQELPQEERDQLGSTFVRVLELFESTTEPLSQEERRAWFQQLNEGLEWFTHLVGFVPMGRQDSGAVHSAFVSWKAPNARAAEPSLAELEKLNIVNRLVQWRQAIRESFSTGELEANGLSRQQLEQWRKRGKIIGLYPPFGRGFVYPAWEFLEDARPHPLIPRLAEAAHEARLDGLALHRLMVSESATPDGPLMNALKAGEDDFVVDAVRASGAQGS